MPPELVDFIENYGYLAIFLLIFAQEIGIPVPVPNELVLMFIGYLSLKGFLFLPFVILIAFLADFIGTSLLYILFFFFGTYIINHKWRWFPLSKKRIISFSERINKGNKLTIYLCRFTPFVRGYVSIVTGLTRIKPSKYLPITFITAAVWSTMFVLTGRFLGPYFNYQENNIENVRFIIFVSIFLILLIALLIFYFRKRLLRDIK
jgi:membrane protein DedA with SNARE-associated domain